MKVVVAMDSFKGSLSSVQAGWAVQAGILAADQTAQVIVKPLADGGEGLLTALAEGLQGNIHRVAVTGPLYTSVQAEYAILPNGTAVIEMAQAAGLPLVTPERRDPRYTTTYGVGELIRYAIAQGVRDFIIGLGGSATNDGGLGLLAALGYEFLDDTGRSVALQGSGLAQLVRIEQGSRLPELEFCRFRVACDVNNPLYGPNGAAYIYAPQKGATAEIVRELDAGLMHFAEVCARTLGEDKSLEPGTGAAGGLGFALVSFLKAELCSGVRLVIKETALKEALRGADLLITGEGRLDAQTAMGKAPSGVAKVAKDYNVKVIAVAGCIGPGATECHAAGIDAYFSVVNCAMDLERAMQPQVAFENIKNTVQQIFRLLKMAEKIE